MRNTTLYIVTASSVALLLASGCSKQPTEPSAPTAPAAPAAQAEAEPTDAPATGETTAPTAGEEGVCELDATGDTSGWSKCVGSKAGLTGVVTVSVHQHPSMTGPDNEDRQLYLSAGEDIQVIVLTRDDVKCQSKMRAVGELERIDMGGDVGKRTYKGWAIKGAKVTCPE